MGLSSNLKHLKAPQQVTIKFRLELLKTLEILKFLNKSMLFCSELMDSRLKTILDVEKALAPLATNVLVLSQNLLQNCQILFLTMIWTAITKLTCQKSAKNVKQK